VPLPALHPSMPTRLSSKPLSSSRVQPCIHMGLWLCHRPQWAIPTNSSNNISEAQCQYQTSADSQWLLVLYHFSTELLSTSDSTLIPYLNTDSPFVHGFLSFTLWSSVEQPSLHSHQSICPIQMTSKSVFEDSSDIKMEDLYKSTIPSSWKSPYNHSSLFDWQSTQTVPHPCCYSANTYALTVVSEPALNDIAISPLIPTDPLFPLCLWPQSPYHLGEDILEVGRGTHCGRVEARDHDHYGSPAISTTQELSSHLSWPEVLW